MTLRVLRLSLNPRSTHTDELPPAVSTAYLGGRGLATWLLSTALPPNTGPLSPDNLLIFSAGVLSGTGLPGTGGFVASTRSPLTGAIAHSWAQGRWGGALRRAGYDALVLSGQSPEWSFIQIDGKHITVRPVGALAGLDTYATSIALHRALGPDYSVLCIGPAGEAGVAYSSIVADGAFMAEPAGTGAVMAHKRIKAIAVRGGDVLPLHDVGRAQPALEMLLKRTSASEIAAGVRTFGSSYHLPFAKEWGALTSRNGQDGRISHMQGITRTTLARYAKREPLGCEACPLQCVGRYQRTEGGTVAYPELETVAGFGARCGIGSIEALIHANDQCMRLGLDPVSTSNALAFMAECQERGLSHAGTLTWGDDDAMLAAISRLGQRQEKRDVLSLGVGEMQEIFWGSAAFAPHVKGLAMPALDPRALHQVALATATSPIGGDYRYAMTYEELLNEPPSWLPDAPAHPQAVKGKAVRLIWHERFATALDAAGICRKLGLLAYQITPAELVELVNGVTGGNISGTELAWISERTVTLERLFMLQNGTVSRADGLPKRWREEPLSEGRAAGHVPQLDDMLPEYYRRHGWDEHGAPQPQRLAELGIEL